MVLPARMWHGASWSDACILNVSSRGLLIHTSRQAPIGSAIELRRGEHVIVARVVWRNGATAGLRTDDRVSIEQIVTLGQSQVLQVSAPGTVEQRGLARPDYPHRVRPRAAEFASVLVIGASLAGGAMIFVAEAFARPLAIVQEALGG